MGLTSELYLSKKVITEEDWKKLIDIVSNYNGLLKTWKLESLGGILTAKMRIQVFIKYLELHLGFFDIDYNSPGSLLTKLAIDTIKISAIM